MVVHFSVVTLGQIRKWIISLVVVTGTALWLMGCQPRSEDARPPSVQADTVARYGDGTARVVELRRHDSLIERQTYHRTGTLRRIERGDSVAGYLDLHALDSSDVLKDYLQGDWRNLDADRRNPQASAFYTFHDNRLTFSDPGGAPLETIQVTYAPKRRLEIEGGGAFDATIAGFDTVRVSGLTLVRADSTTNPWAF